ncbi:MAG: hypothetical protein JXO22_10455, partial [Phycisphaerae bacterium]|nr:hypothetical protein [Phycisphaerae bacterium]
NLDAIIDGIVDVRYDGHLPYDTYDTDPNQPVGGDYYELDFSCLVRFDSLVYYEGDIRWNDINGDPHYIEPRGGYFIDLGVEVCRDGDWTSVDDLMLSEPLDRDLFYQVIELTFDSVAGDGIRIRGTAGGTHAYTSIVELVAEGAMLLPGDLNCDGATDVFDIDAFVLALVDGAGYGAAHPHCDISLADCNDDGAVDVFDIDAFVRLLTQR